MTDKPTGAQNPAIPLPDYRILVLQGADALRFAQSQFMNDVLQLADGQWQWNGWLNAKGRLIALFALLRLDAQTLWLLLPDYAPDALASGLATYVFRSKVTMQPLSGWQVYGQAVAPAPAPAGASPYPFVEDDGGLTLPWPGGRGLCIRPLPAPDAGDVAALMRWRAADLSAGIPRLVASQSGQWTPQQLSLARLAAYSVKKGCYPGQEIVARTHFLGQAKRSLALLEADAPVQPGDAIEQDGSPVGTVIATAGTLLQAVLPALAEGSPLQSGSARLRLLPQG